MQANCIVYLSNQAERDLFKLDKNTQDRILKKLKELKTNPRSFKVLHGILKGKYSVRIGDYRAIYRIKDAERKVEVITIDHRKRVYDRFEE